LIVNKRSIRGTRTKRIKPGIKRIKTGNDGQRS